ncbi:uncharacterized protein BROUX77_007974 [Berkeleyomyces rouxiae]|uniref:uncharacterized protein n=1 Tax=Berkeleyomyces rouxiae TaxID=2035830 RepID=UPI003B80BA0C
MSLSSWHERGRPALFEALAAVCDKIEEELEVEVHNKANTCKHNLKPGELEALQARAIEADRLEKDNHRLREALSRLQKENTIQESSAGLRRTAAPAANTTVSATTPAPPIPDASTTANIIKLESSLRTLKKNFLTAKESLIKRKNERDQWIEYSKNLERKVASLKTRLKKNQPTTTSAPGAVAGAGAADSGPVDNKANDGLVIPSTSFNIHNIGSGGNSGISNAVGVEAGEFDLPPISSMVPPQSTLHEERICDSQPPDEDDTMTSDGAIDSATQNLPVLPTALPVLYDVDMKNEPSSDGGIQVVEERAVKKRRYNDEETGKSPAISRIKDEHLSDPLSSADVHAFSPQESVDLDNVGIAVETPRKGRSQDDLVCSLNVEVYSSQVSVIPDSPHQTTLDEHKPTTRPHSGISRPCIAAISPPTRSTKTPIQGRTAHPLLETRTNVSTPVTAVKTGRPLPRGFDFDSASPLQNHSTGVIRREGRRSSLSALNTGCTTSNHAPDAPASRVSRPETGGSNTLVDLDVPEPRQLPFDNMPIARSSMNQSFHEEPEYTSRRKDSTKRARGLNISFSGTLEATTTTPRTGTIRNKKPHELRPEDFKINPKFNGGHNYAFSEVVRGRSERAALPGCTDPTCCGQDFRMLARSERGIAPRTTEQYANDKIYLEKYLGDDCFRLFGMTREEMDELWVEAKAKELADRWGKHRHRFARMKSPPGFWNPDFPTTQEVEDEREEAGKRRLQEVEGRYREAMRPGGRWIFRDEE